MKTLFTCLFLLTGFLSAQTCDVCGYWYPEESHNSVVEMYLEDGELKGKIVWMEVPRFDNGAFVLDSLNRNARLQNRPILGMVFLYDFEKDGAVWEKGKVYNSRNGKTYSAEIELTNEGYLKLTGYVGMAWLGKSVYWERATDFKK